MIQTEFAFLGFFITAASLEICTDLSLVPFVQENSKLTVPHFLTVNNSGLVQCAIECQLRTRCRSFNVDLVVGQCQLLEITSKQTEATDLINVMKSVHSEKEPWPTRLAGFCSNHSCPGHTACQETGINHTCIVTHCVDPPPVNYGDYRKGTRDHVYWDIGEAVEYICNPRYRPVGHRACKANGEWSSFGCSRIVDCTQVKTCNNSYGDGEYWIALDTGDRAVSKIYCNNMSTESPKSYISLVEDNYSISPETCTNACGTTSYRKVRFFMSKMLLHLAETTFAKTTSSCEASHFGTVLGCEDPDCGEFGTVRIDIRGTGFSLSSKSMWKSDTGKVEVTASTNWTVVTVRCKDKDCKRCNPVDTSDEKLNSLDVEVNPYDRPPDESAIVPVCYQTS